MLLWVPPFKSRVQKLPGAPNIVFMQNIKNSLMFTRLGFQISLPEEDFQQSLFTTSNNDTSNCHGLLCVQSSLHTKLHLKKKMCLIMKHVMGTTIFQC